jgi:Glucose-6-phosphate dehydrogenase, C-terminal domain
VLDTWAKISSADLAIYPAGSAGPSDADALLAKDGRRWRGRGGLVSTPGVEAGYAHVPSTE